MKRMVLALAMLALNNMHAAPQESAATRSTDLTTLYDMPVTTTALVYVPLWAITPGHTASIYQRSLLIGLLTLAGAASTLLLDTTDILGLLSGVANSLSDVFYFEQFGITHTEHKDRDLLIDLVAAYAQQQGLLLLETQEKQNTPKTPT